MTDESRQSYPYIPSKSWFALRKKWQTSVPRTEITPSYVASLLDMDTNSAQRNVIRGLKTVGLLGEDNRPTDLAMRWRLDDQYAEVCKK